MGSQFVDLDADGFVDYLTATFDGSPHVAYGTAQGFAEPVRLKDAHGQRILISSIWNYETSKHENLGRAMPDGKAVSERCISALAFDWDADGDYDLLLGSYENGHLYRQMNEGSNREPELTGKNIPVLAGGKPFALPAKMTAPRLVDWDGDGDLDLVAGTFGDCWGQTGMGGGVYLARNLGKPGSPEFGALETLIAPKRNGGPELSGPNAGLYPEVADVDGDGDLDLVVGAYSLWQPVGRELTDEEQAKVAELQRARQEVVRRQRALSDRIRKEAEAEAGDLDRSSDEYREIWMRTYKKHGAKMTRIRGELERLTASIGELVPAPQRRGFIWLFERR